MESPNSEEERHQSVNNSGTTSKDYERHASPPSKAQIDLNFQPEKDEESPLPRSKTTTKDKSLHHDEARSSSSAHNKLHVDFADS
ncbi:hypothetical protein Bca52824_092533 [Brassica carinata]|nr:hypothetical protein Bca52824_092533 [Brassica carinata]